MGDNSQHIRTADTTVEGYLRGCVGFEVDDSAINTILIDRNILPGTDVTGMDKRTKELCRADLYMWCASTPSVRGSVEDANGVWKHKEGGAQSSASDKSNLREMANDIYRKYGENTTGSTIKFHARGMKVWRR